MYESIYMVFMKEKGTFSGQRTGFCPKAYYKQIH